MSNKQLEKEVKDLDDFRKGCVERFHSASEEMERLAKENREKGLHEYLGTGLSADEVSDMMKGVLKDR